MARNIKKEKKKLGKAFWISVSAALVVVVVGLIIGIFVAYANNNTADIENKFAEYTSIKLNANEVDDVLKDENYTKTIIITYNNSFRTDFSEEDDKTSYDYQNYVKANNYLAQLVKLVNKASDSVEENKIAIYLINTSLTGNSSMEGKQDYNSNYTSPALLFFALGDGDDKNTYKETMKYKSGSVEETYNVSGGGSVVDFNEALQNTMDYIKRVYNVTLD